ncbi:MAG TPA: hypothetical protein VLC55_11000 [Burkholderiales bacterium]|nr:hypothetical protein [Burkholderiales bacterium]
MRTARTTFTVLARATGGIVGQIIAVAQETTETFHSGGQVRIVSGGGSSRAGH